MAAHVPEYIKSSKLKSSLEEDGEPKKWEYGEIALVQIGDVFEKYCSLGIPNKKYPICYFIHHSLFILNGEHKKKKRAERTNTPEALYLIKVVNDIKRNSCCCVCGYKEDIRALIFDHVEPDKKSADISELVQIYRKASNKRRPIIFQKTVAEIAKCVIMCANCHFIKTSNNKCGYEKRKTHYTSPEDFLIQMNRSTAAQQTFYIGDYDLTNKVLPFPNPNNSQENDIKLHIIDNELCVNI